jgi:ligand-binding SRPBCC domain-containing protein
VSAAVGTNPAVNLFLFRVLTLSTQNMRILESKQFLPIPIEQAWEFFSSPENLNAITPPHMGFKILSGFESGQKMHAGMVIRYLVSPIAGIPMNWVTEITHVDHMHFFVDEQRFGPYAFWHHQHIFRATAGGTEMTDIVHYKVPLGPLGLLADWLFVRRQVQSIFDFRTKKLEALFPVN